MKRQLMAATLPTLELSRAEQRAVHDEAWLLIRQTLELETEFYKCDGYIDPKEWKEVTATDDLHIYRPRKAWIASRDEVHMRGTLYNDGRGWGALSPNGDDAILGSSTTLSSTTSSEEDVLLPPILCAGHVEGTLEDLSYGAFDGDESAWRIRSAYMKDKFADSRILATIQTPTHDEPFSFLGIKWFTTEYPPVVGAFVRQRDSLVIEALGTSKDHDGVTFGYYVLHDFRHHKLPELRNQGVIRNKLSICYISRQTSPYRMRMYARGRLDIGGNIPPRIGIHIAAVSLTSSANLVETSYKKKLAWLVAQQSSQRRRVYSQQDQSKASSCRSCQRTPRFRPLVSCQVCGHSVCSKCSVVQKLVVDASTAQVVMRSLSFWYGCVLKAKQLSPVEIARVTIVPSP
ncbi:hypothetical protein Poli38472_012569 [Pythium oligandrum]|uniref:FYVE-type domain-containing protein n=1 Tax=Pythium oligandrum TaxID=41045 RepID=A0A8K1FK47_PYTOL|nr:hypothetical protein Poli38472_012569 [Pythium oligandrum]|eukprot:TMW61378.1 hypothetical protein Poli38472_012569 [Pythium oligandrum]